MRQVGRGMTRYKLETGMTRYEQYGTGMSRYWRGVTRYKRDIDQVLD